MAEETPPPADEPPAPTPPAPTPPPPSGGMFAFPAAVPEGEQPVPPPPIRRYRSGRNKKADFHIFQPVPDREDRVDPSQLELQDRIDWYLNEPASPAGKIVEVVVGALILIVCTIFAINTVPWVPEPVKETLFVIELAITVVFLIEYIVRWWAKHFSVTYLFTPMAVIDLVSILPLFMALIGVGTHLQLLRVLRLFRILRLLRLVQSRKFFFGEVTREHLMVLRILFTVFCLVFVTGGLVYELEHEGDPVKWESLFDGIYFAVVTLTTVGFGDLTPATTAGKMVTMIMILVGVVVIPWQLTTLAKTIMQDRSKVETTCKHCGLTRHDQDASHCKACGNLIYQEYAGDELV